MKKISMMLQAGLVCAVFAAGGCGKSGGQPGGKGGFVMPPALVRLETAALADVPVVVTAYGQTTAVNDITIMSQVSGKLTSVHFADGDMIKAGDILFTIDDAEYRSQLVKAEAALEADRAALRQLSDTLERSRPLFEKELVSKNDFETMQRAVEATAAKIKVDEASIVQAKIYLGYCTITAPVSGAAGRRLVDPGNIIGAAFGAGITPLVNIKTLDPLRVDFTISEKYLSVIRREMASATPPAVEVLPRDGGKSLKGVLKMLDNTVNPTTGTIGLRAEVTNADRALWPGQFVDVVLTLDVHAGVVTVADGAIQLGKQGAFVYVAKNGVAELRPVQPGERWQDHVEILAGVAAGDQVVVQGHLMLFPGAKVMDAAQMPPAAASKTAMPPAPGKAEGK